MSSAALTPDEQFFYDHAGYSHDPRVETEEEGHTRCARGMAAAEARARGRGWRAVWERDRMARGKECCAVYDERGVVVASLTGIGGATASYRRVVEASLAAEGLRGSPGLVAAGSRS